MFKKIAVIVAMLGIVGGAILTPLLSRAQTTVAATGVTINISDGGVDTAQVWTVKMDIAYDYKKYGEPQAELKVDEVKNGDTKVKQTFPRELKIIKNPNPTQPGPVVFKDTIRSAAIIRKGYSYSATVTLRIPDTTITPAQSNVISFTVNDDGTSSNQNDQQGAQTTATSTGNSSLPTCWKGINEGLDLAGCASQAAYYVFFVPTSFIFSLSGQLLDWAMSFTLDPNSYKGSAATFVESGWKITRDIANILFIFILLVTGIGTILGSHSVDAKKTIGMVIVIALLLNFSLFFARVIIDASNILGGVFYNNIGTSDISTANNPWLLKDVKNISTAIVSKFNPQSLFAQAGTLKLTTQSGVVESDYAGHPPALQFGIISLIMAFINCVGIWVFASVAFLFISRVAGLWLAMIFAPLAFISYILPTKAAGYMGDMHHSKWWGNLASLAMVVPVFMFFMYLILKFMNTNFIDTALGEQTTTVAILGVVIPLLIIAILLTRARKIALDMSGKVGEMAAKAGTFVAGGAVGALAGVYAATGRATLGRLAYNASNNEELKNRAAKGGVQGMMARAALSTSTAVSKSSFDLRNTKAGNELSKQTGMNLNSGLSFAGLDTKGTDGGWLGLQARKAEKDAKFKETLGFDQHAYEHEEEKIGKEKDKQAGFKDIKEDLANKIRIEKEQIKTLDDSKPAEKILKAQKLKDVAALTSQMALVDQNIRAFEKGGRVYSINSKGELLDDKGVVTKDQSKAKMENHIGIQTMEKNKERIKTARQKEWESTLRKRSNKRFANDERDELGNIKKFGKEITPEYKKELQDDYNKKADKLKNLKTDLADLELKIKDPATNTAQNRDFLNKTKEDIAKTYKDMSDGLNKIRKTESTLLKTNFNGVKQAFIEFGQGFAKGAGAVTATAFAAGMVNEAFVPGSTGMIALGAGVLAGMKQAFEYSSKTNQSHADGHIPHYHGGHSSYHEPSGGGHDTASAPSSGGGGADHSHGGH